MPSAPDAPKPTFLVPFLIALLCVIWGSTWWAIRVCLEDQPPLSSAALRFAVAGIAMVFAVRQLQRFDGKPPPPAWLWLAAGTCSFAGSYGVLYVAEQVVPSGIAAVLWAIFPLLMAASGVMVLGERLRLIEVLGFLVSFAGVVCVFNGKLGGTDERLLGFALLLLVSPVISAVGTTLVKKFGQGTSSLRLNRNGMLFGAALLAAAAFATEDPLAMRWTLQGTLATLYLALFGTALTFGTYFWLLQRVPASRLALISYVTPVFAMLLGVAVGDGTSDVWLWLGTGLVVGGVALVVRKK
jgi:drug/metabolite transporter (DMT)-like permease